MAALSEVSDLFQFFRLCGKLKVIMLCRDCCLHVLQAKTSFKRLVTGS